MPQEVASLRDIASELAYGADGPSLRGHSREGSSRPPGRSAHGDGRPDAGVALPGTAAAAVAAACAAVGWPLGERARGLSRGSLRWTAVESLIVEGDQATLVACVDDPPAGKAYEVGVEDDRPRPAGLFAGGCRRVPLEESVEPGNTVPYPRGRYGL